MSYDEEMDGLSKSVKFRILLVSSLGLFIAGFNMYISSVAEPFIKMQYNPSALSLGLVQAAAPIGAALGAIVIGRMLDKIGRNMMMMLNILFFVGAAILSGCAWNVTSIIIFRFIVGFGVGADYPVIAVYLSEMTSKGSRGKQLATAMFINCLSSPIGVLIAYILFKIYPNVNVWRLMFFFGGVVAIVALLVRVGLPESIIFKAKQEKEGKSNSGKFAFRRLFSKKYLKIALVLAFCWFLLDISYYGIGLYTPEILKSLNFSTSDNFFTSTNAIVKSTLFVNSFIALGALISIFIIDKIGRRKLQKLGFLIAFFALFALGLSTLLGYRNVIFILVCFAVFNIALNAGPGITTYVLPSELFPTRIRGTGHGFASGIAKTGAFLGTICLPMLQVHFGIGMTVILISLTLIIAFFLSFLIPKETANISLELIDSEDS